MTITTTIPVVGDRVTISGTLYDGLEDRVGKVGRLIAAAPESNCCGGRHRFEVETDDAGVVLCGEVTPEGDSSADPFAPGTRVRLLDYAERAYVRAGQQPTGTVDDQPNRFGSDSLPVKLDFPAGDGGYGDGVYTVRKVNLEILIEEPQPEPVAAATPEPSEAEATIARLREQRDKAYRDLEIFRDRVRDRLIEEAERRDWCSEADDWLESLGLERREPPEMDFRVDATVTITLPVSVYVTASDDDTACEMVDYDTIAEQLRSNYGRDISGVDFEYEIDSADEV